MAKSKNHYYVLVMTNEGPVFVTEVNYSNHTAEWNRLAVPKEFPTKAIAEDLVLGLNLNLHQAYLICHKWEIAGQPYRYSEFNLSFTKREDEQE